MGNDTESIVRQVMQKYGIPDYIWYPIARAESGFNAMAVNSKGEMSKGIFQINVNAHPEYKDINLYDPQTNAEIAAQRFIGPAYQYAKTMTDDPQQQALIVYSGLRNPQVGPSAGYLPDGVGIRPKWTDSLMTRFTSYYNDFVSGAGAGSVTLGTASAKIPGSTAAIPAAAATAGTGLQLAGIQSAARFLLILGLIIVGIIAVFSLFKDTAIVQTIKRGAKAAATSGISELTE